MLNISPYVRTVIDWEAMDKDWGGSICMSASGPIKASPRLVWLPVRR